MYRRMKKEYARSTPDEKRELREHGKKALAIIRGIG